MKGFNLKLALGSIALIALLSGCEGDKVIASEDQSALEKTTGNNSSQGNSSSQGSSAVRSDGDHCAVDGDRVYVMGSATVKAVPDIAQVQFGVQTFDESVDEAVAANNSKSAAIQEALTRMGIAASDMQTSGFSIYPQMDYEKDKAGAIVGYWVNNTLSAKVRELTRVGEVLQAGIDAGANNVSGVFFSLEDPDALQQEARVKAVEDALRRAKTLVEAAGAELGRVLSIRETSPWFAPPVMRAEFDKAAGVAAVPVQPGELEVTVQVEVTFAIE